jgi:hypothetical protein
MYSYVSMVGGDEPESASRTSPAATTSRTTTGSQQVRTLPIPDAEGDSESGFSHEWISNHEANAARRRREVREASGGHVPEYRTSPQQQGHQQQMEVEEEERECKHSCYDSSKASTSVYRSMHHLKKLRAMINIIERLESIVFRYLLYKTNLMFGCTFRGLKVVTSDAV